MTAPATRPTVVVIVTSLRSGSVGAVAWRHAQELSRTFNVHIIARDTPATPAPGVQAIRARHRSWTWLRRFGHVPNELAFLSAIRRELQALSKQQKIDVVWCHSHASTAWAAATLKLALGFRVIMTTHGDIFDRPTGTYSRDLTWFYKTVTPRAYRRADMVHVLSPYMREWAIRGGAHAERVRFIPNGIDPADLGLACVGPRHHESFMPAGVLRLLYVGSLWTVKGVHVLLQALRTLRAGPGGACGAGLTVVGEGPARAELIDLVSTLGLGDAVLFRGAVARTQLASHYAQADILCIPSLSEALPTVAMEAMLCGLPVVGSDTGGIPVLVDDGVNGYLAQPGESESLADCLRKAADSPRHLAELGGQGFAKVRDNFSWRTLSTQLESLVQDAIDLAPAQDAAS